MVTTIVPPIFGVLLSFGLLFLLSKTKKHKIRWILIAFAVYYVVMFALFGDYSGLGSFPINALAYFICLPIFFLPFFLHGIFNKADSFFYTLIFPSGIVLTEFIGTFFVISPGMNIAYRFFYVTPLIQCASLIGAAGLSFLIGWFISSLAIMISEKFKKKYVVATIVSATFVLTAFVYGEIRLNNAEAPTDYIRAAWTTGPELVLADCEWSKESYEKNVESFLKTSKEAYDNGAEILVYAEESFGIDKEKTEDFLSIACERAKEYKMAILIGLDLESADGKDCENCFYFIDKNGNVADKYTKHMVIPIVETGFVRGKGKVSSVTEKFECGEVKLAGTICYDGNFEIYSRKMENDADIYLYPSWDWAAIENNHTMIAGFRAVENGITILKPTMFGRSTMFDSYGRIIFNSHTSEGFEKVYVFDAPLSDKVTFYEKYAVAEDILFVICAVALFTYMSVKVLRKKKGNDKKGENELSR